MGVIEHQGKEQIKAEAALAQGALNAGRMLYSALYI